MAEPYVPNPALDEWEKDKGPTLLYADGQEIRVGDVVDFGFTGGRLFEVDDDWPGDVMRVGADYVVVDTHLNSWERFDPEKLKLLEREKEQSTDV
jgi:hypothetical protein